jgi:hypothetical protein
MVVGNIGKTGTLVLFSFLLYSFVFLPGKLDKAFDALAVYNYFEAKNLFYKSLKKDSVPAAYGLSIVYGRNDNPFYEPDSAFKYVSLALNQYPDLDSDKRESYAELGVDSASIAKWALEVDLIFYRQLADSEEIEQWNDFIENHNSDSLRASAVLFRDQLAYNQTLRINSAAAFRSFLELYPESVYKTSAQRKLEQKIYEEATLGGLISEYQRFIRDYPESPYKEEAEFRIYEKYAQEGTVDAYTKFIEENPNNPNTDEAWRKIYALEVGSMNARTVAEFTLAYPDFPFMEELQRDFTYSTISYYPVQLNGKWGFIDEEGELRIRPKYDWVEPFSENLALVSEKDRVFFIDKAGERLSELSFDDAYSFKDGFALVEKDALYGIINRLGEVIVPIEYEDLGEFSDGFFYVSNGSYYGYFRENGQLAINFQYDNATNFVNGRAVVSIEGSLGLINERGEMVSDFRYDWIEPFNEDRRPSRMRIGDRYGLIDQIGNVVCDTIYDRLGSFSNGLLLAARDEVYGFLDLRGDTIIDFKYSFSPDALERSVFKDGYAMVFQEDKSGMKTGIIDSTGIKVFPAIFEDVGAYSGSLIPIKKKGKWGYADLDVNLAIPYKFKLAENFKDSVAIVSDEEGYSLIDRQGSKSPGMSFTSLEWIDSLLIATDTLTGVVLPNGEVEIPLVYDSITKIDRNVLKCLLPNGLAHYYNLRRKEYIWRP